VTVPYALVGEVFTPEAVGPAAVVIQDGKIVDLLRSPRPEDLPPEQRRPCIRRGESHAGQQNVHGDT
jgi:hypothetical protein